MTTRSRSTRRRIAAPLLALLASASCGTMRGPAPAESVPSDVAFLTANGVRFGYRAAGEGPLVLLLHGFPDSADGFQELLPDLTAAGFRAVAVFQRGYFPSEIPLDGDYSFRARGEDILAIVEALGRDCAAVVGHDWGASSGYAAAALEPSKVVALVALGLPHQRALRPLSPRQIVRARHVLYFQLPWATTMIRNRDLAYLDALYRRWSPGWAGPDHRARIKKDLARPKRFEAAISYYRALVRDYVLPSRRRLGRRTIQVPMLLVMGSDDRAVAPAAVRRHCSVIGGPCEVAQISRAGHFPHLESQGQFRQILLDYLGSQPVREDLNRCR